MPPMGQIRLTIASIDWPYHGSLSADGVTTHAPNTQAAWEPSIYGKVALYIIHVDYHVILAPAKRSPKMMSIFCINTLTICEGLE